MRIGLVIERFEPRRGGLEQWSAQFARELVRRGCEVHVAARSLAPELTGMGLVFHRVESARSRCAFAQAAEGQLRRLSLDVIHDTGAGWHCDVFQPHGGSRTALSERMLELAPRWLRGLKRRVTPLLPRYRDFRRLLERQYADDGRLLVALSRGVADDFRLHHEFPAKRIRLVYNGVDPERFSPHWRPRHRAGVRAALGVPEDAVLLLTVAHNFRLKGVPWLLRALQVLAARGAPVHVAVVGGRHAIAQDRLICRLGVAEQVRFVGAVEDTMPYYAAADVYVQPTWYDPCSLVALEALACGLPVVTTRQNGAAELMTEGLEGHIIPRPDDTEQLVARLVDLLDPARRQRQGLAARQLALRHTFARNVDEMLSVYREIVETRRARAACHACATGDRELGGFTAESAILGQRTGGQWEPGQPRRRTMLAAGQVSHGQEME